MIYAYVRGETGFGRVEATPDVPLPAGALWLDLLEPTPEERAKVEAALALTLPSHEKIREIEPSSRLYVENEVSYMTATILAHADAPNPSAESLTFVLTARGLVTMRYAELRPMASYAARLMRHPAVAASGEDVLVGLLESFVDRIADVLEKVALDLDHLSQSIFDGGTSTSRARAGQRDPQAVLKILGRNEDITSTARESLLSMIRLIRFISPTLESPHRRSSKELRARIKTVRADIASLSEHAAFESHTVNFLLDATLGMINIEQNRIIKIFSIVAVIFLPPTLVASLYGMNFRYMPELDWSLGYPVAIALMLLSAVLPLLYFRRKGWM